MSTEFLRIRQDSYESNAEGTERPPRGNRRGELVVCDFWTQLMLDGRMFHMQIGTESTAVNSTGALDDQTVWMLVDGVDGWTLLPALYEDAITTASGAEFKPYIVNARTRPLPAVVGIGSILGHFGASTADVTGFGCLQWGELESEMVV